MPFFKFLTVSFKTTADIAFADSHTLWAQHSSGTFSQLDLRYSNKTINVIPRTSLTREAEVGLVFISGKKGRCEVPFDDMYVGFSFLASYEIRISRVLRLQVMQINDRVLKRVNGHGN
jgi:hypothetical protein